MKYEFSDYEFTMNQSEDNKWGYVLYKKGEDEPLTDKIEEYFTTRIDAYLAAIGHISMLEKGGLNVSE